MEDVCIIVRKMPASQGTVTRPQFVQLSWAAGVCVWWVCHQEALSEHTVSTQYAHFEMQPLVGRNKRLPCMLVQHVRSVPLVAQPVESTYYSFRLAADAIGVKHGGVAALLAAELQCDELQCELPLSPGLSHLLDRTPLSDAQQARAAPAAAPR